MMTIAIRLGLIFLCFLCCSSCSTPYRAIVSAIPVVINGKDPPFLEGDDFSAPLDLCAVAGLADVGCVKWACDNNCNVNIRDGYGFTPLHSVVSGSVDAKKVLHWNDNREQIVVNLLLDHGANINAINYFGMTPLQTAAMANNLADGV